MVAFTKWVESDYVTAYFYLLFELLTVKENVLYMSFIVMKCVKRSKYMVVAERLKNHLSFLKHNLFMNNKRYQISYLHYS